MEQLVTTSSPTTNRIKFPSWLGNNQKVMYLKDGIYVKGVMEWSLDETSWRFSHRQKMALNSLVSYFQISAMNFKNTLTMVLFSQVGIPEKNLQTLALPVMSLLAPLHPVHPPAPS
jgi:hypothetical protein